jgi:hypothetical protein
MAQAINEIAKGCTFTFIVKKKRVNARLFLQALRSKYRVSRMHLFAFLAIYGNVLLLLNLL